MLRMNKVILQSAKRIAELEEKAEKLERELKIGSRFSIGDGRSVYIQSVINLILKYLGVRVVDGTLGLEKFPRKGPDDEDCL